jgi:hypothetical protein
MPFWKAKVTDHDKEGKESESGYYISEPDEVEGILTAYDVHSLSRDLHEGTDEVPNVVLEQIDDNTANKSGGWISNFFGK